MSAPAGARPDPAAGAPHAAGAGPQLVLLNGEVMAAADGACVSPLDRGLHYGDGLFETMACTGGRARFLSLHLERLAESCQRLHLPLADLAAIRDDIDRALAGKDAALLKLIVTRGAGRARGYGISGSESPMRLLMRYAWPAEMASAQSSGVRVRIANLRLGENPALAGMKHLNRLEQVLARAEVPAEEAAELLLFSSSGRLVCGTMSNVFVVHDSRVTTPRLDRCGVAGVMRRVLLREAAKAGIAMDEAEVSPEQLDGATEVFLTNARIGIWPVCRVGDRALAPGDVTHRLQALIAPMLENPVDA